MLAPLPGGAGVPPRFWKVFWGALVAEVVATCTFYGLEWNWLRELNLQLVQAALNGLGCSLEAQDRSLTLPGRVFLITPDCTYVDLIICSFPLLWRVRRSFIGNCGVLTLFAMAVFAVNLPRVALAVYVTANGGSLFWSHDMVDYVLWYPTLAVVALGWLRSLGTLRRDFSNSDNLPPEDTLPVAGGATP